MRVILLLMLAIVTGLLFAQDTVEIIQLQHRPVSEVIDIIKPFVEEDGTVRGAPGNQLIIRSTSQNLQELQALVEKLDVAAAQLMIYVSFGERKSRQRGWSTRNRNSQGVRQIRVEDGQFARIEQNQIVPVIRNAYGGQSKFNSSRADSEKEISSLADASKELALNKQDIKIANDQLAEQRSELRRATTPAARAAIEGQINTLENQLQTLKRNQQGLNAQIKTLSKNKSESQRQISANSQYGGVAIDFTTLPSGLYVRPKLIGTKVNLQIVDTRHGKFSQQRGVKTSKVATQLTVSLGQWTSLGGTQQTIEKENTQLYSTRSRSLDDTEIFVMIKDVTND